VAETNEGNKFLQAPDCNTDNYILQSSHNRSVGVEHEMI